MDSQSQKVYAITGGTGSLGTALARRLLAEGHKVRAIARGEAAHERLIQAVGEQPNLSTLVADVRDLERMRLALKDATDVIHAAAMKSIALADYNPAEATRTNVQGTENVARAALDCGVERAILVSTDKAVEPITNYGATKQTAERIVLAPRGRATKFGVCRYGNVIGSQGSVVPLFKRLAKEGKPIPVTDERMDRFAITLTFAVDYLLVCENGFTRRAPINSSLSFVCQPHFVKLEK